MTAPLPALERERWTAELTVIRDALAAHACHVGPGAPCLRDCPGTDLEGDGCGKEAGDALLTVDRLLAAAPPPVSVPEGLENAANVRAYLDEAESEWRAARDDSGYKRASMWAMRYGRKLIAGWRRAAQDLACPPPPAAGLPTREAIEKAAFLCEHWAIRLGARVDGTDGSVAIGRSPAVDIVSALNTASAILALIGKGG